MQENSGVGRGIHIMLLNALLSYSLKIVIHQVTFLPSVSRQGY